MNALIKKLRLYRVWTVCKIIPQYYKKSKKIAREHNLSTLPIYWDMMRSLFKFGASDENYEQYHFWEHDDKYKDSFITWRRNMAIMYKFKSNGAQSGMTVWKLEYVERAYRVTKLEGFTDVLGYHGFSIRVAGEKGMRAALPHSRVMIHQPMGGIQGQASDIEITAKEILKLKDELYQIISDHSGQTMEKIRQDADRDYWMTAVEAQEYGMIDKVYKR